MRKEPKESVDLMIQKLKDEAEREGEIHDKALARVERGPVITLSNAVINGAQMLSLSEKRLVMLAVSMIDSRKTDAHKILSKIRADTYAETFGVEPQTAYEQMKAAAKALYKRSVYSKELSPKGHAIVTTMRWIGRAKYHEREGWIELAFHWEIVPHLFELKRRFTSYHLAQAQALRSIYSWRLLEMIMQYKDTGWLEIDIEKFAYAMEATEKQRADFNNIRRRMIEPAIKELREKDGWILNWGPIKAGRKVKGLRFEFRKDPQEQLPLT